MFLFRSTLQLCDQSTCMFINSLRYPTLVITDDVQAFHLNVLLPHVNIFQFIVHSVVLKAMALKLISEI
jgi:hypothetical protein